MIFLSIVVFLFIVTVILYWYLKVSDRCDDHNLNIRKLKSEWLLGVGLSAYGKCFHEAIDCMINKYGDIFSFEVFFRRIIIVSRIDYIEHILKRRELYEISSITTRNFSLLFPNGLLSLKGVEWKRHARVMLPIFRRSKILPYFEIIVNCIDDFIDQQFVKENKKIHKNLVSESQNVLLRIISRIAFNYDFSNLSTNDGENIHQAFNKMIDCASQFALMTVIPLSLAKLILKLNYQFQRSLKIMKHYVQIIINDEQKRQQTSHLIEENKTLISSLIESSQADKNSLTTNEIFDEISMSILAGFETTSTAFSWFIYYISKYPNVQQKLKDELKENDLTLNKSLTYDLIEKLIYLDCVTKELLRFSPIAAGIVREATENDIIDGIQIKKGDIVLIAIQNLHRNSKYWKIDPNIFYPERFLNEDKSPPRYAYLPFGGGHRTCIGQDLAILELKTAITRLMQRVTIQDTSNQHDNSGGFIQHITCFPKHMAVRVTMDSNKNSS